MRKVWPKAKYRRKHTCRCMWCDQAFETVRQDADTCSNKCRGRVFRFRQRTGLEPVPAPGDVSVEFAIRELVALLFARERKRRQDERFVAALPAFRPPR